MKKIVINEAGGYDKLRIIKVDDLKPNDDQVLVDVVASGVNYADCLVRFGVYASAKKYVGFPITPGFEFSGYVADVGKNCKKFKVGDAVYGVSFFGSYASQVLVSENLIYKTTNVENIKFYAGFPVVFFTAYYALFQIIQLPPFAKILIHSAAGGVGTALIQLAKIKKFEITAVVGRQEKKEYIENLGGVKNIIVTSKEDLWHKAKEFNPNGYDAIFDANGYKTYKASFDHLAQCGKLICYGAHSMMPKKGGKIKIGKGLLKLFWGLWKTPKFNPFELITKSKTVGGFNLSFILKDIDKYSYLFEEAISNLDKYLNNNELHFLKTRFYPLEDVALAHRDLESGKTTGKLILTLN